MVMWQLVFKLIMVSTFPTEIQLSDVLVKLFSVQIQRESIIIFIVLCECIDLRVEAGLHF